MRWLLVVALIILIGAGPGCRGARRQQSAPKAAPNPPNPTVVALSKRMTGV
jgi:hypothetical protein